MTDKEYNELKETLEKGISIIGQIVYCMIAS